MEINTSFLKRAIEKSLESKKSGLFPAGAVIILNNEIISESVSDKFPGYAHAESSAVDLAFKKLQGPLTNAVLFASMEPCLMCLARAYNAGVRKIVFAISRSSVPGTYYEGKNNNTEIIAKFNETMGYVHVPELEQEALKIVNQ